MTRNYLATVSRTLNPSGLGLSMVMGQHDRRLTDADVNLIQDIQDSKRKSLVDHQAPSGCLTLNPFTFLTHIEDTVGIPAFNVLFRGQVIPVSGNLTSDSESNRVVLPSPKFWAPGLLGDPASIYVVFLEVWEKSLDPESGDGFYIAPSGSRYFYPNGCVTPDPSVLTNFPDDTLDPFQNVITTARLQTQWALRVQKVPVTYDFSKYRYGMDPDPVSQGSIEGMGSMASSGSPSDFTFSSLMSTSEPCLWRAGDGNPDNLLQTVDGYTYALPVGVIFQRNTGIYTADGNPFGCGDALASASGRFMTRVSGRLDGKYADIIYPEDVVDTRLTVSLDGYDVQALLETGLTDIFMGNTASKLSRGETPGAPPTLLGSSLSYTVSVGGASRTNVDKVGDFDGFSNGFSSDDRSFLTTVSRTLSDRIAVGDGNATSWGLGDKIQVQVPPSATVASVFVQGLSNAGVGGKAPLALLGGQVAITGLNTRQVTVEIATDLTRISVNPASNPILVTIGVRYATGVGSNLRKVPAKILGGELYDAASGDTIPVFGVSSFDRIGIYDPRTTTIETIQVYNPSYSKTEFGTVVKLLLPKSSGVAGKDVDGRDTTTFTVSRKNGLKGILDGYLMGLYVVGAEDGNGNPLHIASRSIYGDQAQAVVDTPITTAGVLLSILCGHTTQILVNPPVKAVVAIEETVAVGNAPEHDLSPDPRVVVDSVTYDSGLMTSTIVCHAVAANLKGFSGYGQQVLVWAKDVNGAYNAITATVSSFGAISTVKVIGSNLTGMSWFIVGAITPAFNPLSTLTLSFAYVPYQGEGIEGRSYTVIHASDEAQITTNGTGAAPIVGLQDVFPFNRSLPLATTLPSLDTWEDSDLKNQALAGQVDSNYVAKSYNSIEHTFGVKVHTNDFIEPVGGYKRKKIRLSTKLGGRGFSRALPHIGFAIEPLNPKTSLKNNVTATSSSVTLYVNNVAGNDGYDGLTKTAAKRTIKSALDALPPVIKHPVSIVLVDTGSAYSVRDLQQVDLDEALIGDDETRSIRYYCLGSISFTMQGSARITIGREGRVGERVVIDASGFPGFGDGNVFAFYVSSSRVILHGIKFVGFKDAAVKVSNSDVELLDCSLDSNISGVSADQGSLITLNRGEMILQSIGTGVTLVNSNLNVSGVTLSVPYGQNPNAFFVAERNSSITLQNHSISENPSVEFNITLSHRIALAQLSSTITSYPSWVSKGYAQLKTGSTLSMTSTATDPARAPFYGGVNADPSSSVVFDI